MVSDLKYWCALTFVVKGFEQNAAISLLKPGFNFKVCNEWTKMKNKLGRIVVGNY